MAAPTTDGEDIAEIGTHRKESNMEENQKEINTVGRFNSATKN